jgi:hypothetical protein
VLIGCKWLRVEGSKHSTLPLWQLYVMLLSAVIMPVLVSKVLIGNVAVKEKVGVDVFYERDGHNFVAGYREKETRQGNPLPLPILTQSPCVKFCNFVGAEGAHRKKRR